MVTLTWRLPNQPLFPSPAQRFLKSEISIPSWKCGVLLTWQWLRSVHLTTLDPAQRSPVFLTHSWESSALLTFRQPPEVPTQTLFMNSWLPWPFCHILTCSALSCIVPKFIDLGGRRHPVVNNFPLSHVIFEVNFPFSNDPLALLSAKRQQQRHNTRLSLKSTRLSSFIEFISHILLRVFPSSWLFNAKNFHSDSQAKL